jgi:hypothetical protein
LGRNGDKRAPNQHRHDDGAQPETLFHEFLRNKDADTSRLDALGELSSVGTDESIMPQPAIKNGHFKQNPTASQAGRYSGNVATQNQ